MDHHVLAAVSIIGVSLDVLGGLYLAYDLLGGQYGPLRLLTRAVTYSIVFGVGFGLSLGLFFGVVAGTALGLTLSVEMRRIARQHDHYPFRWEVLFSFIRSAAFGVGLYPVAGLMFSLLFTALLTVGQSVAVYKGIRPGMDYSSALRARLTKRQFLGVVLRTVGYTGTALVCSLLAPQIDHRWLFALRVGLTTGIVTAVGTSVNPLIEYYADNLAERRLGAFGIWLVLCGFLLQSVQYWVALLDIPVS